MALSDLQKEKISTLLEKKIEDKLKRYARETSSMPFLTRLIQDSEKVAAYSFIHSIATTLGMSIYEDVSKIIAEESADDQALFIGKLERGIIQAQNADFFFHVLALVINYASKIFFWSSASEQRYLIIIFWLPIWNSFFVDHHLNISNISSGKFLSNLNIAILCFVELNVFMK